MTTAPGYAGEEKRYTFMVPPDSESVASNEPKPELGMVRICSYQYDNPPI